jgi:heptosyltransferase-2
VNLSENKKVYTARTLNEVREILRSADESDIGSLFKRAFITTWVFISNCSLRILRFLLFEKWGYAKREFENIVVYTVGIVGDNVVMLPALAALRRRYRMAKITVITNCQIWDKNGANEVLGPSPYKDNLIILDDHPVQRRGIRFLMDRGKFFGTPCDLFVNLSPFGNRGWIGAVIREMIFAKKLGARYAIGFRMSTYSRRNIFNKVQHHFVRNEPRRSEEVLKEIAIKPVEKEDLLAHDPIAKESVLNKTKKYTKDRRPIFVINPGAKFESKCWPAEYFAEVSRGIKREHGSIILITGIGSEKEVAEKIAKASGDFTINLAGETTIQELIELLRISKGCITNDTGTMHLAAMIGIPTVAIFSTRLSPTHWLPVGDRVVAIFSFENCSFCYKDECTDTRCLRNIETRYVLQGLREVLSDNVSHKHYNQGTEWPNCQTIQG